MVAQMMNLESAARLAMGGNHNDDLDPLPPGPNYGPFGYFRLALLIMAVLVAGLMIFNLFAG